MAPLRSNISDEATKRLVELETEYRTQRSAEQLHAVASFPHLFDEFPYAVIINAGILKLADWFRNSNNIQRHAILQVFKKSQRHLKMVVNVEETIKRISPMLQSNDPLARAITLRIIHSLDSSEAMEVSAAIYAADMLCAQSQRFCAIISGKLAFMVRDIKTPLPLKRRLIRIFGHMFEDITLARLARKTCLDILNLNQDGEYTVAILRTLTRLASHSLVDVNQQIDLLLQRTQELSHSQPGIRRVTLMCVGSLAQKNIEFSPEQIRVIFDIALESNDERTTLRAMATLRKIFCLTNVMTSICLMDSGTESMKGYIGTCLRILERSSLSLSSPSTLASVSRLVVLECYGLLSIILPSYQRFEGMGSFTGADETFREAIKVDTRSMEQFLVRIWSQSSSKSAAGDYLSTAENMAQSRTVLWSLVTLTLEEDSGVDTLLANLMEWIGAYKDISALLAKALFRIAQQQPRRVHSLHETIMVYLESNVDSPDTRTFILVYRALLESFTLKRISLPTSALEAFETRISQLLEQFGRIDMMEHYTRNHWELYQIARYSLQTGWSSLASLALRNQEKLVTSVSAVLWLMVVQTVALIESSLQNATAAATLSTSTSKSSTAVQQEGDPNGRLDLYSQQQMYIKELEAHQVDRTFHLQLCSLRCSYLQVCQSTVATLQLLSTTLSTHHLHDTAFSALPGDEIALHQCAARFNQLAHEYTLLRTSVTSQLSSFPTNSLSSSEAPTTDTQSDGALQVLQTICLIIAYAVQKVAKILGRADAVNAEEGKRQHKEEDLDDVFDIDPLLIPLLYLQGQELNEKQGAGDPQKSYLESFKSSTRLTLNFLNDQVKGGDIGALERGISIARQLISQYVSLPIAIPQEFFVSARSQKPIA
ncbi:Integrator complex subunit 7 [Gamsiella multidivaricata]|nr:Integrator complex subunit 7 [Gamsiella multidivaricata]